MTKNFVRLSVLMIALACIFGMIFVYSSLSQQTTNAILTEEEAATKASSEAAAEETALKELVWKTYSNPALGFSIKYPAVMGEPGFYPESWAEGDTSKITGPSIVSWFNPNHLENPYLDDISTDMYIYLADIYDKTIKQFMNEDYFPNKAVVLIGEPSEIIVGTNTSGYEYLGKQGSFETMMKYAVFTHGEFLYVFSAEIQSITDVDPKNNNMVYDQMLKSIQFVNSNLDNNLAAALDDYNSDPNRGIIPALNDGDSNDGDSNDGDSNDGDSNDGDDN